MRPLTSVLFLSLFNLLHCSVSATLKTTTNLFSPVTKDDSTGLYSMLIYLKTPLQPAKLHLDLGSYLPWYDCPRHYKSTSYQNIVYNSSLCLDLDTKVYGNCFDPPGPGCSNDTCEFFPENPVTRKIGFGDIVTDRFALFNNPKSPVQLSLVPSPIVFSCTSSNKYSKIFRGLAGGSTGLAALGRFKYSIPAVVSRAFSFPQIFAICLPGSSKNTGLVVFNSPGPYHFSPGSIDVSKSFTYTPLILGPVGDTQIFNWYKSPDYYIGLTSIKINGKPVQLNRTLLAVDEAGYGGTKISSSRPYAALQTSIFKGLTDAFVKEASLMKLKPIVNTPGLRPFTVCYKAGQVRVTPVGPDVPSIDLVLGGVSWRIYGSNSMVRVRNNGLDAWCLGFVDGGVRPRPSIVIGGHQCEDNLLQFDLEKERLGFSSSLLVKGTTCDNYMSN